ncbi:dihydrofolate reductase [Bacillus wiedmannii]|uniref:dihydrofolate reductase n=1 Tax=Bacillus cereus group TaxID=86661 RepID=UPI000BEE1191|nr:MULTISPECIES: dihydrofolate reductase [Bacillus cereus group]PEG13093.1 dihydrofolate reductase [Bacillus toyonensis]PEK05632.1 dihydrofolate reductase [Bacillus toyonensis]PEL75354.1 dihydrofolate reductase [Bacillus wiedmannii]PEM10431.1 dihydrofolate reductase [Bacillus toyonensis]PEM85316.1 dihydrofolate reductase [Bacillus wiedmannii]
MIISAMVAVGENNVIGKNNDLPWRLPNDWAYLRRVTMGHSIILGRKNYESIGKPLDGRKNIILTTNKDYRAEGCHIAYSIEDALSKCEGEEVFILGGEEIYRQFLSYTQKLYITKIHATFEGDRYFPEIDFSLWKEIYTKKGIQNDKNPYEHYFHVFEKISL